MPEQAKIEKSPEKPQKVGFLEGTKVMMRGFRREDLSDYRHWLDNPEVSELLEMGWRPMRDKDLEATFQSAAEQDDNIVFTVVDKSDGRAVGTAGLYQIHWIARRAQFNILIGKPDTWNKGLGTECLKLLVEYGFDCLCLEVIFLGVNEENSGAIRSYEKAGFVHEGVRRKFVYRNGRHYNSIMMSMIREEYEAGRAGND